MGREDRRQHVTRSGNGLPKCSAYTTSSCIFVLAQVLTIAACLVAIRDTTLQPKPNWQLSMDFQTQLNLPRVINTAERIVQAEKIQASSRNNKVDCPSVI
jgi:hypothetical protein